MGEFYGVGSTCDEPDPVETTPLYLNEKVISAVGGALTVFVGQWALNRRRRKRK